MPRRCCDKLVLRALESHGPLTDRELAWWMSHFGVKSGAAKASRRRLSQRGLVRFTRKFRATTPNHYAMLWEAR